MVHSKVGSNGSKRGSTGSRGSKKGSRGSRGSKRGSRGSRGSETRVTRVRNEGHEGQKEGHEGQKEGHEGLKEGHESHEGYEGQQPKEQRSRGFRIHIFFVFWSICEKIKKKSNRNEVPA